MFSCRPGMAFVSLRKSCASRYCTAGQEAIPIVVVLQVHGGKVVLPGVEYDGATRTLERIYQVKIF
jgi:hypothetical protein